MVKSDSRSWEKNGRAFARCLFQESPSVVKIPSPQNVSNMSWNFSLFSKDVNALDNANFTFSGSTRIA